MSKIKSRVYLKYNSKFKKEWEKHGKYGEWDKDCKVNLGKINPKTGRVIHFTGDEPYEWSGDMFIDGVSYKFKLFRQYSWGIQNFQGVLIETKERK